MLSPEGEASDTSDGMNPWQRLLTLFGAVVLAVLVLRVLPGPVVLALFVAGIAVANHMLRRAPKREISGPAAEVLGLEATAQDPFGIAAYPLSLFDRGSDGRLTDLMYGRWGALDVKVFDYTYTSSVAVEGVLGDRAFTCALTAAPLASRHLVVEPEAFLTAGPDHPALPEVTVGSERFDRSYDARCDDPGSAAAILDDGLTSWLLEQGERWGLELHGRLVMLYAPKVLADDRPTVLDALKELLDQIPALEIERNPLEAPSGSTPGGSGAPSD